MRTVKGRPPLTAEESLVEGLKVDLLKLYFKNRINLKLFLIKNKDIRFANSGKI